MKQKPRMMMIVEDYDHSKFNEFIEEMVKQVDISHSGSVEKQIKILFSDGEQE